MDLKLVSLGVGFFSSRCTVTHFDANVDIRAQPGALSPSCCQTWTQHLGFYLKHSGRLVSAACYSHKPWVDNEMLISCKSLLFRTVFTFMSLSRKYMFNVSSSFNLDMCLWMWRSHSSFWHTHTQNVMLQQIIAALSVIYTCLSL